MAIFKCKMCGGALEINNNESVATCEYCGTQQTLPKLDDDKRVNLYDRANHFRRNNEFDKAMGIYENILNEDNTDAEAYWSLVLCRYGIEYVEDPATHKRIPTVNRAQFTSVFDDDNYKSALQYADTLQRALYEEEAKTINEIQKGILAISQNEEPFDVFICYKETDNNGRRTPDSVLANDLYHQLIQEGYKVFFARITLEDKLGTAYEPYIFAALNSAKVMVALGTKPEYFNAVWVKNEWSRYLALIKQGQKKILIPAYKDMDPYDLPEEFSHLQAQDMSKLGFMQDLIRGIKKIAQTDEPKATVVQETVVPANTNTSPLLKRAFMFLEDGEFDRADDFCEQVLNIDPENAQAYLGKLMVELRVNKEESLKDQEKPFDDRNSYQKILRFGDENLKATLAGYIDHINVRNENARLEGIYRRAKNALDNAKTNAACKDAARLFETISEYKDSAAIAQACYEKIEELRKDEILANAKAQMIGKFAHKYEYAIKLFETIPGWKDADESIKVCKKTIEELKVKAEAARIERERQAELLLKEADARRKRNNKILMIVGVIALTVVVFLIVLFSVIIPNSNYNAAQALMDAGKYVEALSAFEALDGYSDSAAKIEECKAAILENKYNNAVALMDAGKYKEARSAFVSLVLDGYKDSLSRMVECKKAIMGSAQVGDSVFFGEYEQDNKTSNGKEDIEWLVLEVNGGKALVVSKYALDCKQYNTSLTDVTWETCTLRTWLNNDFINTAFSVDEKAIIPTVTVSADKNPQYTQYSINPGNATQDQVFLLSTAEVNKYFTDSSARQCKPTDYAVANGAWKNDWWWLRTPGYHPDRAVTVENNGDAYVSGDRVDESSRAVRPAMWIDLNP